MYKLKFSLLIILVAISTLSCTSKPLPNQEHNNIVDIKPDNTNNEVEDNNEIDTVDLFPSDKVYKNEDTITMTINNEEVEGHFVVHKYSDFGLYIPEIMSVIDFEDGNTFFLNEEGEFIKLMYDKLRNNSDSNKSMMLAGDYIKSMGPDSTIIKVEDLEIYTEYLGSKFNEFPRGDGIGKEVDYFLFKYNDKNLIVELTYNDKNRDNVLPIFLEVIKTIKYIPTK